MNRKTIKAAFPHTIPVLTGYVVLGIGFGILLQSKGFSWIWSFFMSIFIFAGSMQYASINLLASGADYITCAIMTLVINFRHLFYGIAVLTKYKNAGKAKPLLIHELTDETFSLVCSAQPPEDVDPIAFYLAISVLDHLYWIFGCTFGAILGSVIHFNTMGIDFVMTALFIVIFTEQWLSTKDHLPACTGLVITLICLVLFGSSKFLIPALITITAILTLLRNKLEKEEEQ